LTWARWWVIWGAAGLAGAVVISFSSFRQPDCLIIDS
jgi:hypothetical protein